jgi:hypothetical protein
LPDRPAASELDEHQARRWTSWRRWPVFAMLAHAPLDVIAAHDGCHTTGPGRLIAST